MSHTELHELESARAATANVAATVAELALALLVVSVWVVTCFA